MPSPEETTGSPEARAAPTWVFWSTRGSIDNDIPSVTAIIETVVAVPLYWLIAIHFETYLPLLFSAVVAPLVLLRSEQSVALGVKWITAWEEQVSSNKEYEDMAPQERVGAVGALAVLIGGIVLGGGLALGVFLSSLGVRIAATVRYIGPGIRNLPHNFRRLVLCTSPCQSPELVPGLPDGMFTGMFTPLGLWKEIHLDLRSSGDYFENAFTVLFYLPFVLLWFLPGWLYRLTLKSTAWFWWPLAYLGGGSGKATIPDEWRRATIGSLWAKASFGMAAMTMMAFVWANFIYSGAVLQHNPLLVVVGYFLIVDWSVRPWQLLPLALAVLSVALVFLVDDAAGQHRLASEERDATLLARARFKVHCIEYLGRLRLIVFVLFWLIVAGHTVLYFNSLKCWFDTPNNIEQWAAWVYGERMPPNYCIPKRLWPALTIRAQIEN